MSVEHETRHKGIAVNCLEPRKAENTKIEKDNNISLEEKKEGKKRERVLRILAFPHLVLTGFM